MKTLIHDVPVVNTEEMVSRIAATAGEIWDMPGIFQNLGISCVIDVELDLNSVDEIPNSIFDPCYFYSYKFIIVTNIYLQGVFLISDVFVYTIVSGNHIRTV